MLMNYAIILTVGEEVDMKVDLPKCAIPLLGKPMISYVLDEVKKTSVDQIICISNHQEELCTNIIQDVKVTQNLSIVNEIKDAGYTIILPGDMPLLHKNLVQGLIDTHIKNKNEITVGVTTAIEDDAMVPFAKELQCGVYCVNNFLLSKVFMQENDPFETIFTLCSSHKVGIYPMTDKLLKICNLLDLSEVETELRKSINKRHLLHGVRMENWETITIGPDVKIEPNTWIRSGSILLGNSEIHQGAVIGPNTEINNSKIMESAVVMQSLVNDSTVGKEAKIGPFTHLRMNTIIGDYDRIGNFVEIKNSVIGQKTNVSHLTYVGDTDCGSGVNFGCGVVTVNYDGKHKFRTTIGDNVFIGCNSNLIAPVKVENGGFIAAGSTITEDLKEDDFAIARAKQVTKKGYAKKFGYKKV